MIFLRLFSVRLLQPAVCIFSCSNKCQFSNSVLWTYFPCTFPQWKPITHCFKCSLIQFVSSVSSRFCLKGWMIADVSSALKDWHIYLHRLVFNIREKNILYLLFISQEMSQVCVRQYWIVCRRSQSNVKNIVHIILLLVERAPISDSPSQNQRIPNQFSQYSNELDVVDSGCCQL